MQKESNKKEFGNSEENRQDFVKIIINNDPFTIHRGKRSVSEIKSVGGVPLADALEQVIDGKLIPLEDGGSVVIKGGEEFKSHVQSGGAS